MTSKYLEQFKSAYKNFEINTNEVNQELEEKIEQMEKYFDECWQKKDSNKMKSDIKKYCELAEEYFKEFKKHKGLESLVKRCHEVSQNFVEITSGLYDEVGINYKPIFITIGNVKYGGEDLYTTDTSNLTERVRRGVKSNVPMDFHVWVTLPDLSIIDISLHSTMLDSEGNEEISKCKIIRWREDKDCEFDFEPLFIHTDIVSLVE